jgi:hypothetical protein
LLEGQGKVTNFDLSCVRQTPFETIVERQTKLEVLAGAMADKSPLLFSAKAPLMQV